MPVALTVAGSDCSSGAGLQADLKTFTAHGVYGLTAVTCVVAEVPGAVTRIQAVEPDVLAEQLRLLLETFPIAALKTGMLFSAAHIQATADALIRHPRERRPHLVIDPVMVATSGDPLIEDDAVEAYRQLLFPLGGLLTPNLDEAAVLLGRPPAQRDELPAAAQDLAALTRCPVLLKGGHLAGETATDVLAFPPDHPDAAHGPRAFSAPYIAGANTHGTGCTYSAAIASQLALGKPLVEAVATAKNYVTRAIQRTLRWGDVEALNHFL